MSLTDGRPAEVQEIDLLDCTLRDGMYAVDFQLDEEFVAELLTRMNETPVTKVEVGHGLGLEAERTGITACNIDHQRWSELAGATLSAKPWGMFAQPDFTRLETVEDLVRKGMTFLRVGVEPDRVAAHLPYIRQATELCDEVYVNLMKSSATPVDQLVDSLDGLPDAVTGVYVVDSYGAMLPDAVTEYVSAVRRHFDVVGFHGHDNLGLANFNSVTAYEAGASIVDATLNGIGRGSGNASLEAIAGIIKLTRGDLFDYQEIARIAEYAHVNMEAVREDRTMQVLGAVIGIHSGFFPLVERLAAEFCTDPARLMETAVEIADHSPRKNDFQSAAARCCAA
ncbi:hypothetical protein R2B67_33980 [Streptomyces cyaneofuscatus]|uniref:hypothetical protein n=1 Tax=Streptomyces cyaneofuscatus TaxID=66883 RepID=UPI0029533A2F|nr:hypothetical protein [Streptomyces cyaneofuscatus]WOP13256.1 hypothetical protein R2B67_33980 [Streptomyces cyaneofuscatus]